MREPEITLEVDGHLVRCCTGDGEEFTLYKEHAAAVRPVSLRSFVAAILARNNNQDAAASDRDSVLNEHLNKPILAYLYVWEDTPLPWDDRTTLWVLEITGDDEFFIELYAISLVPTDNRTVERICFPILRRYGIRGLDVSETEEGLASPYDHGARDWSIRGVGACGSLSVGDLYTLRREISFAIFLIGDISMHPQVVVNLMRSGRSCDLLGKVESQTLEAKSAPYENKAEPRWHIELAQDVASFANAEAGGILIVGFLTKKGSNHKDVLTRLAPIPIKHNRRQQYLDILNSRIYPPIDGLEIDSVPEGKGELLFILIPPQAEERKPFIVHGVIEEEKIEAGAFSIVRRRGDGKIWIGGEELHSAIVVGRSFIRTGRVSPHNYPEP